MIYFLLLFKTNAFDGVENCQLYPSDAGVKAGYNNSQDIGEELCLPETITLLYLQKVKEAQNISLWCMLCIAHAICLANNICLSKKGKKLVK